MSVFPCRNHEDDCRCRKCKSEAAEAYIEAHTKLSAHGSYFTKVAREFDAKHDPKEIIEFRMRNSITQPRRFRPDTQVTDELELVVAGYAVFVPAGPAHPGHYVLQRTGKPTADLKTPFMLGTFERVFGSKNE